MIIQIRKEPPQVDLDTPTDQTQCLLLSLPPELRNQIWQNLLVQRYDKKKLQNLLSPPSPTEDKACIHRRNSRFCANILRTCKQINAEGTPILYGENIFSAHRNLLASLPSFVLHLQQQPICLPPVTNNGVTHLIKRFHIFVRLDTDPRFSRSQVEDSFNDAEELRIDVFQAMYGSCDFGVLNLFEGVRGVKNVRIDGSLGDGRYADWLASAMMLDHGEEPEAFYEEFVGGERAYHAWATGDRDRIR